MSDLGRLKSDLKQVIVLSRYLSYSKVAFETGVSSATLFITVIIS